MARDLSTFEAVTIEYPSQGATYCRNEYGVYGYGTYPESSVLAGQTKRVWLDSFDTLPEALDKYPTASVSGCGFVEPSLDHLPDEDHGNPESFYSENEDY